MQKSRNIMMKVIASLLVVIFIFSGASPSVSAQTIGETLNRSLATAIEEDIGKDFLEIQSLTEIISLTASRDYDFDISGQYFSDTILISLTNDEVFEADDLSLNNVVYEIVVSELSLDMSASANYSAVYEYEYDIMPFASIVTIVYRSVGHTGTLPANQPVSTPGLITTRPQGNLARVGHIFVGWRLPDGAIVAAGGTLSFPVAMVGTLTLYAHWIPSIVTINYRSSGHTGGVVPISQHVTTPGNVYLRPQGSLVRTGHSLIGWRDPAGSIFATGQRVNFPVAQVGSVTLDAHWEINRVSITYHGNGHTGGTAPFGHTFNTPGTFEVREPGSMVRTGYIFGGWREPVSGVIVQPRQIVSVNSVGIGSLRLYAVWHPRPNMAFSVGVFFSTWINTAPEAQFAALAYALAGYNSFYSTRPTFEIMDGNFANGVRRMQSDILYFAGHGNFTHVVFNYRYRGGDDATGVHWSNSNWTSPTTEIRYVGLQDMSHVSLVTFAACRTAYGTDNITIRANNRGATTAVGWTASPRSGALTNWSERYHNHLTAGHTVLEAIFFANSFFYLPGSNVRTATIHGNRDLRITQNSRSSQALDYTVDLFAMPDVNVIDMTKLSSTRNVLPVYSDSTLSTLENMLQEINADFLIGNYNVSIYDNGSGAFTIVVTRVAGGFMLNSKYVIFVVDNEVIGIIDNTHEVDMAINYAEFLGMAIGLITPTERLYLHSDVKSATELEFSAINGAAAEFWNDNSRTIITHYTYYFFDALTNTAKILVYTDYYLVGTDGARGRQLFIMPIDIVK